MTTGESQMFGSIRKMIEWLPLLGGERMTSRWVKGAVVAIGIVLCIGAAIGYRVLTHTNESEFQGIEIRGTASFIERVKASLSLLQERAPTAFAITRQYVRSIQEGHRSGMRAYANPPTFDLGTRTAFHSITWCAGSIAHDAYHSKLYHEYKRLYGEPVPDEAWGGRVKELACNRFQLKVLQDIGAPKNEITYLASLDGTHYDVDGDGERTWSDYWKQDW